MKLRDILFIAGLIAVVAVLYFLSMTAKKPPVMPRDDVHISAKTKEDCKACHGPGKVSPLREVHPPKDQCPMCHKLKEEAR